jgi:hypothetical protein
LIRLKGKQTARGAIGSAGIGWQKKQTLCCNGRDRGYIPRLERVPTSAWSEITRKLEESFNGSKAYKRGARSESDEH